MDRREFLELVIFCVAFFLTFGCLHPKEGEKIYDFLSLSYRKLIMKIKSDCN
ncbi:MAG: hypothetical protein ACE5K0_04805 [Candidatus Methanofastidiosia archaeon]